MAQPAKKCRQPAYVLDYQHSGDLRRLPFDPRIQLVPVAASGKAPYRRSLNLTKLMRESEAIKQAVWRQLRAEDPGLASMLKHDLQKLQTLAEAFNGQIIVKAEWM